MAKDNTMVGAAYVNDLVREGFHAHAKGQKIPDNPYEENSPKWVDWRRGWAYAQMGRKLPALSLAREQENAICETCRAWGKNWIKDGVPGTCYGVPPTPIVSRNGTDDVIYVRPMTEWDDGCALHKGKVGRPKVK